MTTDLRAVAAALDRHAPAVRAEMEGLLRPHQSPLYDMLRYHLGWADATGAPVAGDGGKGLRSALCLLAVEAAGGDPAVALPAAAAIELVHNFSLIHDDVMDGSPVRRHRPTVWKLWGRAHAITAGDAMFSLAHLALWSLHERGVPHPTVAAVGRLLDETCLRLCEGQYQDVEFEGRLSVTVPGYLEMVRGKTGALLQAACLAGALLAGAPHPQQQAFAEAGLRLGEAFQIRDDVLGVWGRSEATGKPVGEDIRSKKQALPIALARALADDRQRAELDRLYGLPRLARHDVAQVLGLFEALGVYERAQALATQAAQAAVAALRRTGLHNGAMDQLEALAWFAIERER